MDGLRVRQGGWFFRQGLMDVMSYLLMLLSLLLARLGGGQL